MPNRYDKFKTAFATDASNTKLYLRRLEKTLTALSSVRACQTAWKSNLTEGNENIEIKPNEFRHWNHWTADIEEMELSLTVLEDLKNTKPGKAYEGLYDIKERAKSHVKEISDCMKVGNIPNVILLTLIDVDMTSALSEEVSSKYPMRNILNCEVHIEMSISSEVFTAFETDIITYTHMREAVCDGFKLYRENCANALAAWGELKENDPTEVEAATQAKWVEFRTLMQGAQEALDSDLQTIALDSLSKWDKKKLDYKNYVIGLRCKVAVAATGVAGGIAGLATSPFSFGAGAVLGIWGVATGLATLVDTVRRSFLDADAAFNEAVRLVLAVQKNYTDGSKAVNTAKESGVELLGTILGTKLNTGASSASERLNDAIKKWTKMDMDSRQVAQAIPTLINALETLNTQRLSDPTYSDYVKRKKINQDPKFNAIAVQLDKLLTQTIQTQTDIKLVNDQCDGMLEIMSEVKMKINEGAVNVVKFGLIITKITAGAAVAGVGTDWSNAGESAKMVIDTFNSIVSEVDNELADKLMGS